MEKTKDQLLMEKLLDERKVVRQELCVLAGRLKELNFVIAIVVQRRYENEFNERKEPD